MAAASLLPLRDGRGSLVTGRFVTIEERFGSHDFANRRKIAYFLLGEDLDALLKLLTFFGIQLDVLYSKEEELNISYELNNSFEYLEFSLNLGTESRF